MKNYEVKLVNCLAVVLIQLNCEAMGLVSRICG